MNKIKKLIESRDREILLLIEMLKNNPLCTEMMAVASVHSIIRMNSQIKFHEDIQKIKKEKTQKI